VGAFEQKTRRRGSQGKDIPIGVEEEKRKEGKKKLEDLIARKIAAKMMAKARVEVKEVDDLIANKIAAKMLAKTLSRRQAQQGVGMSHEEEGN